MLYDGYTVTVWVVCEVSGADEATPTLNVCNLSKVCVEVSLVYCSCTAETVT